MLVLCYIPAVLGVGMLIFSTILWQFWLSSILLSFGAAAGTVGNTVVASLVPPEALGRGLARYGSAGWIGAIFGLTGAGYMLQLWGTTFSFVLGVIFALSAIVLVIIVRNMRNDAVRQTPIKTVSLKEQE